jgi:Domain of unknown function (DUF1929)
MNRIPHQVGMLVLTAALSACTTTPTTPPTPEAPPPQPLPDYSGGAQAQVLGSFAPVQPWPVIGVHTVLLPNGKVMSFSTTDGTGKNRGEPPENNLNTGTKVDIWDPATNVHVDTSKPAELQHNLFCSGHVLLKTGQVLFAGGNNGGAGVRYLGTRTSYLFDSDANTWTRGQDMAGARWYPSLVTLGNGNVAAVGGWNDNPQSVKWGNPLPEVWQTNQSTWKPLTGASSDTFDIASFDHLYPMLHLASSGAVVNVGPGTDLRTFDTTGVGAWSAPVQRDATFRYGGVSVLLNPSQVLVAGGNNSAVPYGLFGVALNSAVTVNLADKTTTSVPPMNFARAYHNATLLPNGHVFINGGNTSGQQFDDSTSVYQAEQWNPQTNTWSALASASVPRNYHSTALLLPDGRVLTMGGGMCGECSGNPQINHSNAEIYYPPYLFKKDGSGTLAARPEIISLNPELTLGQKFTLRAKSESAISSIVLIRTGSVTHASSFDQRRVPLAFRVAENTQIPLLEVTLPSEANALPPGYYLLMALNAEGVPSIGRIVRMN